MLRSIDSLQGMKLSARDGTIGAVREFYFDERTWTIHYLVADTGMWLPGREVLISPVVFGKADWAKRIFHIRLTKEQIKESPGIDQKKPVSRLKQIELHRYFGWPAYWQPGGFMNATPIPPAGSQTIQEEQGESNAADDPHLRSTREVCNYRIRAQDGEIGHVADFILNDDNWVILYVVIDTRNWLPGKRVLVSTTWFNDIDWDHSSILVDLTKEEVKESPEYDPEKPVNRKYEVRLYDYYGRPKYWL
ncbi:MAG: PRC-barrel domain-containing protein [Nitrospirota bacterium]